MRPAFARAGPAVVTQYRPLTTESIPAAEASSIVAAQRVHRPISPHLSIYKPQIPWMLSMMNRITGAVLSGGITSAAPFHTFLVVPVLRFSFVTVVICSFVVLSGTMGVGFVGMQADL